MCKKILVVDDDEINLKLIKAMVEKLGNIVDDVNSGYEAIEKIKSQEYILIILDLNMPGIDGYETSVTIRNMDGDYYKTLRIVACTADEKKLVEQKALDAGMNEVINKPVNILLLQSVIEKF
ncbi:MAG: response regulator [Leptospirales bacterium]